MKKEKAVAISYDEASVAPVVVAKGQGLVAKNIIEKARQEGILIYEDSHLVNSLMELNISDSIPEDLYEVVAEIIYYVYSLDMKKGLNKKTNG